MNLLGKAQDGAFWASVRQKECYRAHLDELHAMWAEYGECDIPLLRYRDFILFWTTGDRVTFEKPYFDRRRMLESTALLSLIYPEESKYFDRLLDVIFAVCDEYSWCLPAHQGLPPDAGEVNECDAVRLSQCNRVDLFAAETAVMLAEIDVLLGQRLPTIIRERIRHEVESRVIAPFESSDPIDHWEGGGANWTSVCMGSVACTMMLLYPDRARSYIPRFDRSMETYLGGIKDDGVCTEGVTYWYYGFGYFLLYADMVKIFTEGRIDWLAHPKVKATVSFVQNMFLSGNAAVSFADAGRTTTYHLGILHYLKARFPDDILVFSPALAHFVSPNPNIVLHLWSFVHLDEDVYNHPAPEGGDSVYYAESAQWLVKRTAGYGFAAKAGCNDELHNHNDVGSFIFAKGGRQVFADLGPAVYTQQYFSPSRYDSFEACSRGHSVPVVGDAYQTDRGDTRATDVCFDGKRFSMNIAPAYRAEGLERIDRTFALSDESVTLTDRFDYTGNGPLVERMIALVAPIETTPGTLTLEDTTLTYDASACTLTVRTEPLSRGGECYLIDFTLRDGAREFNCTIR